MAERLLGNPLGTLMLGLLLGAGVTLTPSLTLGVLGGIGAVSLIALRKGRAWNFNKPRLLGRSAWVYAFVTLLSIICFNLIRIDMLPHSEFGAVEFLGNCILLLSAYPFWRYLRDKTSPIPFIPMTALMYGLYFGIPAVIPFEPYGVVREASDQSRLTALELTLMGLICLFVANYGIPSRTWKAFPQFSAEWSRQRVLWLVFAFTVVAVPTKVYTVYGEVPVAFQGFLGFLGELLNLACALLVMLQLRGTLSTGWKVFTWLVLTPTIISIHLASGLITPVVTFAIMLAMVYMSVRKAIPWTTILVALPLLFALQSAKEVFRLLTWEVTNRTLEADVLSKSQLFLDLSWTFLSEADEDLAKAGLERLVQRVNYLSIFAHVVDLTPSQVPYWEGSSYASLMTLAIPRILFPDKPIASLGQEFGHEYFLIEPTNLETSVNVAQLPEMYANFGVPGVYIGMLILGGLFSLLNYVFNHNSLGDLGLVGASFVFAHLTHIESNFSLVFGGLIYWIPTLYLLRFLLRPHPVSPIPCGMSPGLG